MNNEAGPIGPAFFSSSTGDSRLNKTITFLAQKDYDGGNYLQKTVLL